MFVYIAAACLFLFYFAMIPLKIVFIFQTRPQLALSAGASFFEGRFALRRASRPRKKKNRKFPLDALLPAFHAGRYLLRHTRLEYFSLSGVLSLPDAAATALLCGMSKSLQAACAPLDGLVSINLIPDFSGTGSDVELRGMICVRMGHIIRSARIFAFARFKTQFRNQFKKIKESFAKWKTNIPLKTSCTPPWRASAT